MARKFDQEFKDRVVRLVDSRVHADGVSIAEACRQVAPKVGISYHTAQMWHKQARRDGEIRQTEEDLVAENHRLRRENQELRDTNELLKAASAFFASELDPQRRK